VSTRCRWHTEDGIRFLVPGCMNRAVYGDHAMCDCPSAKKPAAEKLEDRVERLEVIIADLRAQQGASA